MVLSYYFTIKKYKIIYAQIHIRNRLKEFRFGSSRLTIIQILLYRLQYLYISHKYMCLILLVF